MTVGTQSALTGAKEKDMATMTAKYDGRCSVCGGPIRVGAKIDYAAATKARHVACVGAQGAPRAPVKTAARSSTPRRSSYPTSPPAPGAVEISGRARDRSDRYSVGEVVHAPKVTSPGGGPDGHYYTVLAETWRGPDEDNGEYDARRWAWVRPSTDEEAAPVAAARVAADERKTVLAYVVATIQASPERLEERAAREAIPASAARWTCPRTGEAGIQSAALHSVALLEDGSVVGYHGGHYDDYRAIAWRVGSPAPTLLLAVRALIDGQPESITAAAATIHELRDAAASTPAP